MSPKSKRRLAIGWTLVIIATCSIPGSDLPDVDIEWIDKVGHLCLFAVFAWLWLDTCPRPTLRRTVLVVVLGSLFGILTELYQGILPWERTPDIVDALADTAGLLVGSAAFTWWRTTSTGTRSNL
jgi:VanZ family protein